MVSLKEYKYLSSFIRKCESPQLKEIIKGNP
jgi:hypothetical protein